MFRKILITGSSGVLGAGFKMVSKEFPDREMIFTDSTDCNLTNRDDAVEFVAAHQPDAIVHLAAVSGGIGLSINHPATLLRDNVYINLNIMEAARIHGIAKTVMTLSTGMYPPDAPNPLTEDYIHDGAAHDSNYSYAFAKRLVEPSIRAYRTEYGMNVIGLAPNGIFGERANFALESSTMWAALIRRFYENRHTEEKIVVWGDGSPLREHTYAPDTARSFMWCLDNYDESQFLNIGTNEELSVKEIAYSIADLMDISRERIEFDITKPAGVARKSIDNSRFVGLSGFNYTPFREGLEKTVQWFSENYDIPGKVLL